MTNYAELLLHLGPVQKAIEGVVEGAPPQSLAVVEPPPEPRYPKRHIKKGFSYSAMKHLMRAPAVYRRIYILENWPEPSAAMLLGSAVDCLVFEPRRWDALFAVGEDRNRKSNADKAWWAQFDDDNKGKMVLKHAQFETAKHCAREVLEHPAMADALAHPQKIVQPHLHWTEDEHGVRMQGIPDLVTAGGRVILDLKTARDASWAGIRRAIEDLKYDVQAAIYLDGVAHNICPAIGIEAPPEKYLICAVETTPPHLCAVHEIEPESIMAGNKAYKHAAWLFKTCVQRNWWPGLSKEVRYVGLRPWAKQEREQTREGE